MTTHDKSTPTVQFPVAFDQIPAEVKKLTDYIRAANAGIEVARTMLAMVRKGCKHENAQRGYNERDGSWMNPCPHCGMTE